MNVVDEVGAEGLDREGGPPDGDVEHAGVLELLDGERVQRRLEPGRRDVLEGASVKQSLSAARQIRAYSPIGPGTSPGRVSQARIVS